MKTKLLFALSINLGFSIANCFSQNIRNWATYYGEAGSDIGRSCSTDANGNVYLAGETTSTVSIATPSAHQTMFGGGSFLDAFLVKFNSMGAVQWATYYGETGTEKGYSCATDKITGDVYLAGSTTSTISIATLGSHQQVHGGGTYDAFLVKFNSAGIRQWATYYGGTGSEDGYSCSTDASGNVYLAGKTTSTLSIATPGAHQTIYGGGSGADAFLVKFNSMGALQWATYYGGTGVDQGYSCATDAGGNVYLGGQTTSTISIATIGSHQPIRSGGDDGFLVQFNSSGVRQWGTYYGGNSSDFGRSCTADGSGNVYLGGFTLSFLGTAIATAGAFQTKISGTSDAFLVQFNSIGVRQWGTYYGGSGDEEFGNCAVDGSGNVYLAGDSYSSNKIASGGFQNVFDPLEDVFVVKFDVAGIRQCATYYGGIGDDEEDGNLAVDGFGNVYVSGTTPNDNDIATAGAHQTIYRGASDAFLVKFTSCCTTPVAAIAGPPAICSGNSTTLTASGGNSFLWSNGETKNTIAISPTSTTSYTVFVTNACGSDTSFFSVTVNAAITASIAGNTVICAGSNTTLTASGGSTYIWSNAETTAIITISPTNNTTYTVTVENTGCTSTATIMITVNPLPVAGITGNTVICNGNSTTLIASGGGAYSWNNAATTTSIIISPTSNTTYTVDVDNGTCVSTAQITITVSQPLQTSFSNDTTICEGENITLFATGASIYRWNTGETTSSINSQPSSTTTYTVTLTNGPCTDSGIINVTVIASPTADAGADVIILSGASPILSASGNGAYRWLPSSGLSCNTCKNPIANPLVTTTYFLTVEDVNGCTSMDSVKIIVELKCDELFIPTAFSPNDDGQNDVFKPEVNCIKELILTIYDRWGEKVFSAEGGPASGWETLAWDGKYKNKLMDTSIFAYQLTAILISGKTIVKKGNISLIR